MIWRKSLSRCSHLKYSLLLSMPLFEFGIGALNVEVPWMWRCHKHGLPQAQPSTRISLNTLLISPHPKFTFRLPDIAFSTMFRRSLESMFEARAAADMIWRQSSSQYRLCHMLSPLLYVHPNVQNVHLRFHRRLLKVWELFLKVGKP